MGRTGHGRLVTCPKVVTAVETRQKAEAMWAPWLDWLELRMARWRVMRCTWYMEQLKALVQILTTPFISFACAFSSVK